MENFPGYIVCYPTKQILTSLRRLKSDQVSFWPQWYESTCQVQEENENFQMCES